MIGWRARAGGIAAIAVAVSVALIMVWGASAGDPVVRAPSTTFEFQDPTDNPTPSQPTLDIAQQQPAQTPKASNSLNWLLIVQIVALVMFAYLLFRWFRRDKVAVAYASVEPVDELDQLLEATAIDTEAAVFTGEPRNAVVACWVALEDGLAASGIVPERSETSLELTLRVLTRWEVDRVTLSSLADLYREARFSRHPITEAQRGAAIAALNEIHASLRRAALRAAADDRSQAHEGTS